jgi:hypothetical protein
VVKKDIHLLRYNKCYNETVKGPYLSFGGGDISEDMSEERIRLAVED